MMGVANGDSQCVGGIHLRRLSEFEQVHDHLPYLLLIGAAVFFTVLVLGLTGYFVFEALQRQY